jgi:hypothetical protein
MSQTMELRFLARVERRQQNECWMWTGHTNQGGYGRMRVGARMVVVHRIAWELEHGQIAEGMFIDHICHNRACVNTRHMQVVTRKANNENIPRVTTGTTSGRRGIDWYPRYGKWRARVAHNGRSHMLGYFESIDDAEHAVTAKRNELFTNNLLDRKAS